MQTIKCHWRSCVLLLAILSSCRSVGPAMQDLATPSPTTVAVAQPTSTLKAVSPTPSSTIPSQSGSILSSATSTPGPVSATQPISSSTNVKGFVPTCAERGLPQPLTGGLGLPGKIVYQDGSRLGLYAVGGAPLTRSLLPISKTQEDVVFGFSPDGNWLAYSPVQRSSGGNDGLETPSVALVSVNNIKVAHDLDVGGFKDELGPGEHFSDIAGNSYWMSNGLLYLILDIGNPNRSRAGSSSKLYDPFAGRWQESLLSKLSGRRTGAEFAFSQDLSLALYELNDGVVLRDLNQDKVIWSNLALDTGHGTMIRWAPNGTMVAVSNIPLLSQDWQIQIVSRDGQSIKTILDPTYPTPSPRFLVYSLSWSPDSRLLGIVTQEDLPTLYIYDATSDAYLYRCPLPSYAQYPPVLVWSPNSGYVALGARVQHLPLQILNVHDGTVTQLVEDAVAVGWSEKLP